MKSFLAHFLIWMIASSLSISDPTTCPLSRRRDLLNWLGICEEITVLVLKMLNT